VFNTGYVTYCGIRCVYSIGKDAITLIPANNDDLRKLNSHFDDQHFLFHYADGAEKNCIAFIDRVEINMGPSINLIPLYILRLLNAGPVTYMQVTGPSIDEVFHPAGYFFTKAVSGKENTVDLAYECETADEWTITINDSPINISLQYGGILRRGIASDMMLHPKLCATFPPTTDIEFLIKVYTTITRFLQLIQYNSNIGECRVYLEGTAPEHNSGYLFDWPRVGSSRSFYNEMQYRYIQPFIKDLLQFSAENTNIALQFLPEATYRWNRTDYSTQLLATLFAAFESEYKANICVYETSPVVDYSKIRENVIGKIHECSNLTLTDFERQFLADAENSIQRMGYQIGQNRKVKNVLHVLAPALRSSAENLFIRNKIGSKSGFNDEEISQISKELVGLRAQVSHEYSLSSFDDLQAEYIHFLEILVHAQMLKRADIDDAGIELIIGIVFHCNFKYTEFLQKGNTQGEEPEN